MTNKNSYNCNCGGCITFLLFLFTMWAIFFGLPTHWGTLELDFFPPAVKLNGITYLGK